MGKLRLGQGGIVGFDRIVEFVVRILVAGAGDGGLGVFESVHEIAGLDEPSVLAAVEPDLAVAADDEAIVPVGLGRVHPFEDLGGRGIGIADLASVDVALEFPRFRIEDGVFVTVIPHVFDRFAVFSDKLVFDRRPGGRGNVALGSATVRTDGRDAHRCREIHRPVAHVHDMTGHVAEGTGAKIPITAPGEGGQLRAVVAEGSGSDPEVPVDVGWHLLFCGPGGNALRPDGTVGPGVDFDDVSDESSADEFDNTAHVVIGVGLVAHLGDDFRLLGEFGEVAGLPDPVGEGLLAVDGAAFEHGGGGSEGVDVVGCGDRDGIDFVAFCLDHLAPVFEELGLRVVFPGLLVGTAEVGIFIEVKNVAEVGHFEAGVG